MRFRNHVLIGAAGLLALFGAVATSAQEQPRERRSFMGLINIDSLVDNYSNFLARKYNLTPEQDEFTHELLREKAHQFWDKNEGNLSVLMDRMFEVRTGGDMSAAELMEWGKQVVPLYAEAKTVIVAGNDEWREILNEEQRKLHDEDLKLMHQSFGTTDEQIERIVSGEMSVEEFRSPSRGGRGRQTPPPQPAPAPAVAENPPVPPGDEPQPADQPVMEEPPQQQIDEETLENMPPDQRAKLEETGEMPTEPDHPPVDHGQGQPGEQAEQPHEELPPPGTVGPPAPEHVRPQPGNQPGKTPTAKGFEGEWDQYVKQFIARYKLNAEQTQRANQILADCKQQGVRVMAAKKDETERLDARIAELQRNRDSAKAAELTTLTQQRQKLTEPLKRIFEQQLKPRLERIPTRAQREAAETAPKTGTGGAPADKTARPVVRPAARSADKP